MWSPPFAIAFAACVLMVGCLGGEDQPAEASAAASAALPECPGGEDDVRGAVGDLGENPQGVPTARGALDRFLVARKSDLSADDFERTQRMSGAERKAHFFYSQNGLRLANVYAERLERGWLVIAYDYCRSTLGPVAPTQPNTDQSVEGLRGQTFVSTALTEDDKPRPLVDPTRTIRLSFGDDTLGWYAGCNRFGADVEITSGALLVRRILGTEMLCPDLQRQDEWVAEFFDSDPEWRLNGARLMLRSGASVIEFER